MNILSAFLVALSLSMDNLAVALAAGCNRTAMLPRKATVQVGFLFTAAHFIMFSVGFLGGHELMLWIGNVGKWVATAILVYIGLHMILESRRPANLKTVNVLDSFKMQGILALATSVDALLVGIGLGLAAAPFRLTVLLLSVCVFITSVGGFYAGHWLGRRFGQVMEIVGGCVLILIGVKWLL